MFGSFPSTDDPYIVVSKDLSVDSSKMYSFVITTKLLYSSKNIADWVALDSWARVSAMLCSGGIKKFGITGSNEFTFLLNT